MALRRDVPASWTLDGIADVLGFGDVRSLERGLAAIDARGYRSFMLLKDGRKPRRISAPHEWLRRKQRLAYDELLLALPVSDAVFNRPGRGVVQNAEQHIRSAYMTVIDVEKCFPSTTHHAVREAFCRAGMPSDVAGALTRLTTYQSALPQGPPTSPAVLDLVFNPIDRTLENALRARGGVYSRYMDDLAFSGPTELDGLVADVAGILRAHGYRCNPEKCREWGPNDRHTVTNIVVTTSLNPTCEFLEALTEHLIQLEKGSSVLSLSQIRGKIAWVGALNPKLARTLLSRFGRAVRRSA